jgi:hypothetical protein
LSPLTPAKIKAFFHGLAETIKAIAGDPWPATKLVIVVSMTGGSAGIFKFGMEQQTPFIELASVYLLYIIAYVLVIKEGAKSDKRR